MAGDHPGERTYAGVAGRAQLGNGQHFIHPPTRHPDPSVRSSQAPNVIGWQGNFTCTDWIGTNWLSLREPITKLSIEVADDKSAHD